MTGSSSISRRPDWLYIATSLAVCFVVMFPIYRPAGDGLDVIGYPIGRDFINDWAGARLAFGGHVETLFDLKDYWSSISALFGRPLPFHNWSYPPTALLLLWPLSHLSYFFGLALWTLAFFSAFLATSLAFVGRPWRMRMALELACAPACIINAVGGQNGFVTGALMLAGIFLIRKRPILAGVLFGLMTFKPQLGLVLPFALIALGAWRTLFSACIVACLLIAASILAFGLEPWRDYLGVTSHYELLALQHFRGFFTYMMVSPLAGGRTFGLSFAVASWLQTILSLVVLAISTLVVRRTQDPRQQALILTSAAALMTPYAFNYDLTALSAALTWRLIETDGDSEAKRLLFRVAWLMPILIMPLNALHVGLAPLVILAVFATAAAEAARPPRREGARAAPDKFVQPSLDPSRRALTRAPQGEGL
jgi:Glycosyltransferase family 87